MLLELELPRIEGAACPRCHGEWTDAYELVRTFGPELTAEPCPLCGMFLEAVVFDEEPS